MRSSNKNGEKIPARMLGATKRARDASKEAEA